EKRADLDRLLGTRAPDAERGRGRAGAQQGLDGLHVVLPLYRARRVRRWPGLAVSNPRLRRGSSARRPQVRYEVSTLSIMRMSASNTSCPAPKRGSNCSESAVHFFWMSSGISITGPIAVEAGWISQARLRSQRMAKVRASESPQARRPWLRRI